MDALTITKLILEIIGSWIIVMTPSALGAHIAVSILEKKDLKKISEYNGCLIKECPFIDAISTLEIKKELDEKKLEILLSLLEKLSNYTSKENLKTVYQNLKTLKLQRKPFFAIVGIAGLYTYDKNKIEYSKKSSLSHEFLHCASSYYDTETKIKYSGFHQVFDGISIGKALNEGYTEILTSRIYNKNKITSYKLETNMVKLLELFFEDPKELEKLYFNHDLLGFVKYMEQFASRDEIINIILKMDKVNTYLSADFLNPFVPLQTIEIKFELYKWFIAHNKDKEKLEKFKSIMYENKVTGLILNNKIKLYRENPYTMNKEIDEPQQKIH